MTHQVAEKLRQDRLTDTHVEIMHHAESLFGHYGYGKTNIGDIAERAGMSPGNLYRYFRNKQAIGEAVVTGYMAHSQQVMIGAMDAAAPDFEARLRAMFTAGTDKLIGVMRCDPKIVELAEMICQGDSGILAAHLAWKYDQTETLLRQGVAEGVLRVEDPRAAAETLFDCTRAFWMPMALAQMDLDRVPARVKAVLDMALDGMRRVPARGSVHPS